MARINEVIPQEEATNIMFQALGILLSEFQKARGTDHLSFDFEKFTYYVGVREGGTIDLEKHDLEERAELQPHQTEDPNKIITLQEFADGK